jgi:3-hydroxypropanoate dehydrogenase
MGQNLAVSESALDTLFRQARTFNAWQDRHVADETLQALYDLLKMGPTAANCCPGRFLFVKSDGSKEKLKPCLDPENVEKTMRAPVTVIVVNDRSFPENLPKLFPQADAKSWFAGNDSLIAETAFRSGTLQGAYLIMAARALGLDCGPMSGFDKEKVRAAFFSDKPHWEANFLVNIGYGDPAGVYPRNPRLSFDEAAVIL